MPARTPAPIIKVSAPRALRAPKVHRRRRSGGGQGNTKDTMVKMAMGGAAIAFIEKSAINIPTIPVLGRTGTIAVAAYFFGGKKPGLVRDIAIAAATLAAYEMARDGKIAGEDE